MSNLKPPTVRRFTEGMAVANPDENEKASKGYVHFAIKMFFCEQIGCKSLRVGGKFWQKC